MSLVKTKVFFQRFAMAGEAERYNFIREKSGLSKKDFSKSLGLSASMNCQIAGNCGTGRLLGNL
jgi:hypothetical protein